jgi:hypothetical protein
VRLFSLTCLSNVLFDIGGTCVSCSFDLPLASQGGSDAVQGGPADDDASCPQTTCQFPRRVLAICPLDFPGLTFQFIHSQPLWRLYSTSVHFAQGQCHPKRDLYTCLGIKWAICCLQPWDVSSDMPFAKPISLHSLTRRLTSYRYTSKHAIILGQ